MCILLPWQPRRDELCRISSHHFSDSRKSQVVCGCVCVCAGVSMQYYEFYDDGEGPDEDSVPKDVNPVGYIAGGDLDFRKRPRPRYV